MMKFYMTPGSCSTGIHILLEEIGLVFEAYIIDLLAGDQYKDKYLAINPKGTIPTLLRDDGTAIPDSPRHQYVCTGTNDPWTRAIYRAMIPASSP
jgi:glutathione S-transferase